VLFDSTFKLFLQEYDRRLTPIGDSLELAPGQAQAASITVGSGGALLALRAGTEGLEGRLIQGTRQVPFQIPEPLAGMTRCESRAASTASGFNLTWTCLADEMEVGWAVVNGQAEVTQTGVVFATESPLRLKGHVHTSEGDLLLLNEGSSEALIVATVTSNGTLAGPLARYVGVTGFGIASREDGIGLIAATTAGRTVFRVLNKDGTPRTGWRCLDDPAPGGHGAIMADQNGYSTVVRHANGSAWLIVLDRDGNPSG
jgi:hypothetical protein